MFLLVFNITDKNEIFGIKSGTFEIWKMYAKKHEADAYRKRMDDEIMPRIYMDSIPGELIGLLITASDYVTTDI